MSHPYSDNCTCPECTAKVNKVLLEVLNSGKEKKKPKAKKKKGKRTKNMTLRELLRHLTNPDHISTNKALGLEVEFCTIDKSNLSLLSVYEDEGKIIIDIGTNKDSNKRNEMLK